MMIYRVLIPAAGTGSRLGAATRHLNKALVSVANRPAISLIIESVPRDAEFVIALGYKGGLLREFLRLAYPERKFYFAEVRPFEGPGSGLGLSVLACRKYLNQPFVFISCDTLVRGRIPPPDRNWAGWADTAGLSKYRTLRISGGKVLDLCEKGMGHTESRKAYIGLAGIHDHREFWKEMRKGGKEAVAAGEAHGLRALLDKGLTAKRFAWHDTGTPEGLAETRTSLKKPGDPNILEKPNEAIWFVSGQVIKFSDDESFISNRVRRAQLLKNFVPRVTGHTKHMYRYKEAPGSVLSDSVTLPLFMDFLEHCASFWKKRNLSPSGRAIFRRSCLLFYRDKTLQRVNEFYSNFGKQDEAGPVNGVLLPKLSSILKSVDWDWLADAEPCRFHGDLHFENVLWSKKSGAFIFLDWRQEFGGSLENGDAYYDMAKIMHGLIISHELIIRGLFTVDWKGNSIAFDFNRKNSLVECERAFITWLKAGGYDLKKVRVLTALIYLNIAALHHFPYSLLLFSLGKSMLHAEIEKSA